MLIVGDFRGKHELRRGVLASGSGPVGIHTARPPTAIRLIRVAEGSTRA